MHRLVTALLALALMACAGSAPKPSPSQSPTSSPPSTAPGADACHPASGATLCVLNPAVTPATIRQTICRRGWTATIRPPASYTDALKRQQLAQFAAQHPGDAQWNISGTEEDHRLALDLGGDPRAEQNLSPEVHRQSGVKDQDESRLGGSQGEVCKGHVTLVEAQMQFVAKWLAPYPGYRA